MYNISVSCLLHCRYFHVMNKSRLRKGKGFSQGQTHSRTLTLGPASIRQSTYFLFSFCGNRMSYSRLFIVVLFPLEPGRPDIIVFEKQNHVHTYLLQEDKYSFAFNVDACTVDECQESIYACSVG